MNKKLMMITGGALLALVVIGAVGAAAVYAQSATPPAPWGTLVAPGWQGGRDRFGGPHELDQAELNAAARVLGMTADELSAELKSGKTLDQIATAKGMDIKTVMDAVRAARPEMLGSAELDAAAKALGMTSADLSAELQSGKKLSDVATEKGVSLQTVQQAVQAAHSAEMTTRINQAVKDGTMSQDKANWLLEGLSKGYLNGPDGFGFGFGPRGGGLRGGPQPQATPSTSP